MKVHYSSKKDEWETPQDLFDELDAEFGFTLDVCASRENTKCKRFLSKPILPDHRCGLTHTWTNEVCWMNPPYGRQIGKWMKRAYEESQEGCTVVCLVPSRTDTRWWHDYAMLGEIRFLRGRLKFVDAKHSAPFPSAIVIFRPNNLDNPPQNVVTYRC